MRQKNYSSYFAFSQIQLVEGKVVIFLPLGESEWLLGLVKWHGRYTCISV